MLSVRVDSCSSVAESHSRRSDVAAARRDVTCGEAPSPMPRTRRGRCRRRPAPPPRGCRSRCGALCSSMELLSGIRGSSGVAQSGSSGAPSPPRFAGRGPRDEHGRVLEEAAPAHRVEALATRRRRPRRRGLVSRHGCERDDRDAVGSPDGVGMRRSWGELAGISSTSIVRRRKRSASAGKGSPRCRRRGPPHRSGRSGGARAMSPPRRASDLLTYPL